MQLPLPQGAVKQGSQETKLNGVNYTLESYASTLRAEEVLSFYKQALPLQGFTLSAEDAASGVLHFANPLRDHIAIMAREEEGRTVINITSWQGPAASGNAGGISAKPLKEAAGEDLAGIPRYPGSLRLSSLAFAGVKTAAYTSEDKKEKIASFYTNQMHSAGWQRAAEDFFAKKEAGRILGEEAAFAKAEYFFFTRKDEYCGILITEACCGNTGTVISLMKLSQQAVEGFE